MISSTSMAWSGMDDTTENNDQDSLRRNFSEYAGYAKSAEEAIRYVFVDKIKPQTVQDYTVQHIVEIQRHMTKDEKDIYSKSISY